MRGAEWKVCSRQSFVFPRRNFIFVVEAASVLPFITVTAIAPGPEGHCATLHHQCLLSLRGYGVGIEGNPKQQGFRPLLNVPVTMLSGSPHMMLFNSHASPNRLILIWSLILPVRTQTEKTSGHFPKPQVIGLGLNRSLSSEPLDVLPSFR